jgi:hypothetical protein
VREILPRQVPTLRCSRHYRNLHAPEPKKQTIPLAPSHLRVNWGDKSSGLPALNLFARAVLLLTVFVHPEAEIHLIDRNV